MAVNYSYKIIGLDVNPSLDGLSNVVTCARYIYTGIDSDTNYSGSMVSATPITPPDSNSFTPLNELTEPEIIDWIKSIQPLSHIAHMNEKIQIQINNQSTIKYFEDELPWTQQ